MSDPKSAKLFPDLKGARKRVVEAAILSIARDGLENLTFATVAAAMDSTASHVKYYFDQKEELIRAAIRHGIGRIQSHVIARISQEPDPRRALEAYVSASFEFLEENQSYWPLMTLYFYYCSRDAEMRRTNQAFRRMARLRIRALVNNEEIASYLFMLVQNQCMEFIFDQRPGALARAKQICLRRLRRLRRAL